MSLESPERDILRLVHSVKRYPCLYNKQHPNYRHKEVTQCVWQVIATKLEVSEKTCKHKWKSLKRRYLHGDIVSKLMIKKLQFLHCISDNIIANGDLNEKVTNGGSSTSNSPSNGCYISPSKKQKTSSENLQSASLQVGSEAEPVLQNSDKNLELERIPENSGENIESISLLDDDSDSDIEEIKPNIECIEVDSSSTAVSDTDDADSRVISPENDKGQWVESEEAKRDCSNFDDFSEFLKFVLDNCRDFSPSLLNEVKDGICEVMEQAKSKMVKKKRKK